MNYSAIGKHLFQVMEMNKMLLNEQDTFIMGGETYLITGANGFIGKSIAWALIEHNRKEIGRPCKIILVVRNREKAVQKYGHLLNDNHIQLITNDNKERLHIQEKVDWIICAAAITKKEKFHFQPADTLNDNVFGIYNCLELAREKKVKGILFISSVQVYGRVQVQKISEKDFGKLDCMREEAIYPESKRMGEMLVWAYSKQFGVKAKCVRLFHVYGEGEEYNNGTFLSDFLNDVISNRDINIKGNGEEIRNLCYIKDVVRGIFCVLYRGNCGEAYNVGSEYNNYTIREYAEMIQRAAREMGREVGIAINNKEYINGKIIDVQVPCIEKLKLLGWKEEYQDTILNFKKMLEQVV